MDPTSHSLNEKSLITPRWSEGEEPAETRVHLGEQSFPNVYEETSDVVSRQGESRTREKLRTIEAQDTFPREAREKMSRGMQKYHRSMLNHPSVSIILLIQCLAHSTALGVQLFSTIHLWQREKIEEPSHMWFIIEYLVLASHFVFFLETFARNHILSYWFLTYGRTACFNTIEVICLPISLVLELIHAGLGFTLGNTTTLLVCRLIVIFFFVPCVLRRRLSLLKSNIRSLVSADRRRYLDMGYDLDITYIARNIIAMSWPSSSIEAFFRNNIKSVAEFMNTHHADCYLIFNLCGERSYDPAHFNGRVQRYFMEDHCPVELETVLAFCTKAHSYLSQDTRHTIVVHCKGGKGRTGMMISCYLLYSGAVHDSKSALEHFGMSRTADGARSFQGVESPSQARFVQYFEKFIREPHTTAPRRRRTRIRKIIVGPLPLEASFPSLMWFAILENQTEQFLLKNPAAHQALPSDAKSHARQIQVQKSPGLRMTSRAHNPSVFTRDPFNYCKREKKHSEKETNCTRQQLLQCIENDAMCYKVRYADSGKTVCGFDFYKTEEAIFLTSKSEMKSEVDRQPALPSLNSIQEVPNVEIVREGPSNDTKVLRRPPEVYIEYDLDEIVSSMRALQHTQEPTGASSDPFDNQVHASSRIAFFYDSCIPLTSESIFQMWFHPAYEDFDAKPSQSDSTSHIVAPKNEKFRTFRLSRKDIDGPHKQTSGKGGVKGAIASAASGMSTTLVFREDFEICMELEVME